MSLRSADVRFLLPAPPRTAFVSPDLPGFRTGLQQAGVGMTHSDADVAVVTSEHEALGTEVSDTGAVIIIGRGGRRSSRPTGAGRRRFVALPDPAEAHVIIPVDRPRVASYAIRTWATPESRARRVLHGLARGAISVGSFPDLPRSITLEASEAAAPFMVAAAEPFGVPPNADWFLTLGLGDALTRAAFQLFARGESDPSWILKFSRVRGHTNPFERDEEGLSLAARAGGAVAAHAPRLLGRFEVDGLPASVEGAALGSRLTNLLKTPGRHRDKLRTVDAVAEWIIAVGDETAAPPVALTAERRRLGAEVVPRWARAGVPADLAERIVGVPAVLQHNDLGCWNIVADGRSFTAVDWESARPAGLPLWDLLYFLVDALVHLDGAWTKDDREAYAIRLLRGEIASSEILFRWVRTAIARLEIPPSTVGPIATLGWLHHGLSYADREAAAAAAAPDLLSTETFGDWMARTWLSAPGLGVQWNAWEV